MPEWVYALLGFVTLTVILTLYSIRQRNSNWQGTVVDIREHSYLDSNETHQEEVHIIYKLDGGRKKKMNLSRSAYLQVYPDLKVGDRLIKEKGAYHPRREPAG